MIKKISITLIVILSFLYSNSFAIAKDNNILWNSSSGLLKLHNSKYKNDFYQLINFYQPQENPVYCAIATATIILNSLNYGDIDSQKSGEITKPKSLGGGIIRYPLYSQQDFLNKNTQKIKEKEIINFKKTNSKKEFDPGLSLSDLENMLVEYYDLKVRKFHAKALNAKSLNIFRKNVKRTLAEDKRFLAVNFDGKKIGQKTNGHMSPIAAYDQKSDYVLVLDVALHKNKWYWVKLKSLYKAMNTKDGDSYRGYLIISK